MAQWTHPQCERCWFDENPERVPVRMKFPPPDAPANSVEVCCTCGGYTIAGIYVRKDPTTIPYPASEDDE